MSKPNPYGIVWQKHRDENDAFSSKNMFFAFSKEDLVQGLRRFGVELEDGPKYFVKLPYGCFLLKTAVPEYKTMMRRQDNQSRMFMKNPDYAYAAFLYELANHEYVITHDPEDAVQWLGFTMKEVESNPVLRNALERAERRLDDEWQIPYEIWDFLSEDSSIEDIVNQINENTGGELAHLELQPFDDTFIRENYPDPAEAVRAAVAGHVNYADDWARVDGAGNIQTVDEFERRRELNAHRDDIMDHVMNGDVSVPEKVRKIRDRYDDDFAYMDKKSKLRLPKLNLKGKGRKPLISLRRK